jgi:hypothetical protein
MSIADAPVAVASHVPASGPIARAAAFIHAAQSAAADGLTWREFGELALALVRLLVESYEDVKDMSGEAKKAAVLVAVADLFDAVADRAVPTVLWPVWMLARPAVRSLVVALASGAVEQVLSLVRA